jgi:hypothetical protein
VNKITDVTNNAINYIYNEDNANGEYTLSRINYTDNSVRLTYEDREDKIKNKWQDSKIEITKRLKNIQTFLNENLIRDYGIEYQYTGEPKISQITKVTQGVNGGRLTSIAFSWSEVNLPRIVSIVNSTQGIFTIRIVFIVNIINRIISNISDFIHRPKSDG